MNLFNLPYPCINTVNSKLGGNYQLHPDPLVPKYCVLLWGKATIIAGCTHQDHPRLSEQTVDQRQEDRPS